MGTSIRDDFVVESEVEVNFIKKEGSYPFNSDGFLDRAENHPLCKAMVNHKQQRMKAGGDGEVSN